METQPSTYPWELGTAFISLWVETAHQESFLGMYQSTLEVQCWTGSSQGCHLLSPRPVSPLHTPVNTFRNREFSTIIFRHFSLVENSSLIQGKNLTLVISTYGFWFCPLNGKQTNEHLPHESSDEGKTESILHGLQAKHS